MSVTPFFRRVVTVPRPGKGGPLEPGLGAQGSFESRRAMRDTAEAGCTVPRLSAGWAT